MFVYGLLSSNQRDQKHGTFKLNLETMEWTKLNCDGDVPSARKLSGAVECDGVMYVFGGKTKDGTSNEFFSLSLGNFFFRNMLMN